MSSKALIWLKPRFIGDAVMATPTIVNVANSIPNGEIWGAKLLAELLVNGPSGYSIKPVGKLRGFGAFLQSVRDLRRGGFDAAVLVERSFRAAAIARLAGIKTRVGHTTDGRGFLLTHPVEYVKERKESDCYLDLVSALGLEIGSRELELWVTPSELASSESRFPEASRSLILQPGSTADYKAIPTTVIQQILDEAWTRDIPVILVGVQDEREYLKGLHLGSHVDDQVGTLSLRESMALLARGWKLAAGDTGLVHIAKALGTPTIAVFGPTPSVKWGHRGPRNQVIDVGGETVWSLKYEQIRGPIFES